MRSSISPFHTNFHSLAGVNALEFWPSVFLCRSWLATGFFRRKLRGGRKVTREAWEGKAKMPLNFNSWRKGGRNYPFTINNLSKHHIGQILEGKGGLWLSVKK
ncbi:hypothetical protein V6Z12_A03G114700 [Gossypium hirsutum]